MNWKKKIQPHNYFFSFSNKICHKVEKLLYKKKQEFIPKEIRVINILVIKNENLLALFNKTLW